MHSFTIISLATDDNLVRGCTPSIFSVAPDFNASHLKVRSSETKQLRHCPSHAARDQVLPRCTSCDLDVETSAEATHWIFRYDYGQRFLVKRTPECGPPTISPTSLRPDPDSTSTGHGGATHHPEA